MEDKFLGLLDVADILLQEEIDAIGEDAPIVLQILGALVEEYGVQDSLNIARDIFDRLGRGEGVDWEHYKSLDLLAQSVILGEFQSRELKRRKALALAGQKMLKVVEKVLEIAFKALVFKGKIA
jgi:hypothetical protein